MITIAELKKLLLELDEAEAITSAHCGIKLKYPTDEEFRRWKDEYDRLKRVEHFARMAVICALRIGLERGDLMNIPRAKERR